MSWFSALPLDKNEFTDALCLRSGWTPPHLPSTVVLAKPYAFSCPHGAFLIIRHNDIRDLSAQLFPEVCHDVHIEPHLHPLFIVTSLQCMQIIPGLILELLASGVVVITIVF